MARALLLLLWVGVAYGGISGYIDHGRLPAPGHAPFVDRRPHPPLAPLIFTWLGIAGGAALLVGSSGAQDASFGRTRPNSATGHAIQTDRVH